MTTLDPKIAAKVNSWLEGDYLTLRPSFSDAQSAYAYRTEIRWDKALSHLVFRESDRLDAALGAGKTKSVIVVAPPRALGMLRPIYSHALKSAVRAELDKDYVKMPVHEIEKHLTAG